MAAQPQPEVFSWTGTLKTFGSAGPMYEVIGTAATMMNGHQMVTIRVFGTEEILDYPLEEVITDPEAV